jgi:hypothetical protein
MKIRILIIFIILLIYPSFAQQEETILIPLSDTQHPVQIKLDHNRGSVTIDGYDGEIVIIHAQERITAASISELDESEKLPIRATEQNNIVTITSGSYKYAVDINIRVPLSCKIEVTNKEDGNITANDINGEFTIDNSGGGIYLNNVSGTAVLSTIDGIIRARFREAISGQPMAFSSMNGTIDVMFPRGFGAYLKMKSVYGRIITDYKYHHEHKESTDPSASELIPDNEWQFIKLNEGGAQILVITYNGDILIRENN